MTEEEVQYYIDYLKAAQRYSPWLHDPRTAPPSQTTRERLAQAMLALQYYPETFEDSVARIAKSVAEDIDDLHPDSSTTILSPEREEFSAWLERDGLREEK